LNSVGTPASQRIEGCSPEAGPDTIYAVASGHGRAAVAIIRLSGNVTASVLEALLDAPHPPPRRASLRALKHPETRETLDQAVVIWMPGPASFTGEHQAELQIHGGSAVRAAILRALSDTGLCRPAEPGEFTRRAFLAGKLDLTAVEGLADLIEAETEAQRRQAMRQLEGILAGRVFAWRERLIDALAVLEAGLDFSDEDDVPDGIGGVAHVPISAVREELAEALRSAGQGERLREGFVAVIAGPPNAGKSTLLNALARREVAIVSPIPGTTRDAIEVRCDLGGLPVTFVDTAGLRATDDPIEQEGVARTRRHMASADLVISLHAADADPHAGIDGGPTSILPVVTKGDLRPSIGDHLTISARTGLNMEAFVAEVQARAAAAMGHGADALVTRERTRLALEGALACLDRAARIGQSGALELAAEDVRGALRALGQVTGHVGADEVLDRVFARFCIGK